MRKYIVFLLALVFVVSCSKQDENKAEMSKEEIISLAIDIQKDFAHLNMQMGDIGETQLNNMNEQIAKLSNDIKSIREQLPKDEVSTDILKKSSELYNEMLKIYRDAGFNVKNMEEKINTYAERVKEL